MRFRVHDFDRNHLTLDFVATTAPSPGGAVFGVNWPARIGPEPRYSAKLPRD